LPGYWFAALVDASLCDVQRRRLSAPCCTKSPTTVDLCRSPFHQNSQAIASHSRTCIWRLSRLIAFFVTSTWQWPLTKPSPQIPDTWQLSKLISWSPGHTSFNRYSL
jgi:hypothetical protein